MEQGIPPWGQELRERMVRMETKMDALAGKVDELAALSRSVVEVKHTAESAREEVRGIQENIKWLWRTLAGAAIAFAVDFLNRVLGGRA